MADRASDLAFVRDAEPDEAAAVRHILGPSTRAAAVRTVPPDRAALARVRWLTWLLEHATPCLLAQVPRADRPPLLALLLDNDDDEQGVPRVHLVCTDGQGRAPFSFRTRDGVEPAIVLGGELVADGTATTFFAHECLVNRVSRHAADSQARMSTARVLIDGTPEQPSVLVRHALEPTSAPRATLDALHYKPHMAAVHAAVLARAVPRELANFAVRGLAAQLEGENALYCARGTEAVDTFVAALSAARAGA